jgi:hypothetical protein
MSQNPTDLQSLEGSGSGILDTLNQVVQWLHSEGLYAAESALLSEIEHRYPDHSPPKSNPPSGLSRAAASHACDDAFYNAVDLAGHTRRCSTADSLCAEKCVNTRTKPRRQQHTPPYRSFNDPLTFCMHSPCPHFVLYLAHAGFWNHGAANQAPPLLLRGLRGIHHITSTNLSTTPFPLRRPHTSLKMQTSTTTTMTRGIGAFPSLLPSFPAVPSRVLR